MKSSKHHIPLSPERARPRAQQCVPAQGSGNLRAVDSVLVSLRPRTGALRRIMLLAVGLWTLDFGLWTSSAAQNTNSGPGPTDYRNFEVIPKKNIFNPRRSPEFVPRKEPQVRTRTETLALVGVMSYGKGPMAFFDGSRTEYRKVLKPNESIAGFKVTAIEPSSVKMASSTNVIEMQLGMQLAREQEGEWKLSTRPESLDSTYARATPMRSASQVNSERASESDQNNGNNPFGQIGNFFANGGFGGNGFPGAPTPTAPTPAAAPTTQPAAPSDPNDILARMAARRAIENGDQPPDQGGPPQLNQGQPQPNPSGPRQPSQGPQPQGPQSQDPPQVPGQPQPNQQELPQDPNIEPAPILRGEPPPNQ